EWVDDPSKVKDEFRDYFASRFCDPGIRHGVINFNFSNRLNIDQLGELEAPISRDEIRKAVWDCAVEWFFHHASFPVGCNSSFIALIPKTLNPKSVGEYRPISLIGSIYKVVTKILANHFIADIISNVQTAFLPNRQILDDPFIINELLARCHQKNIVLWFLRSTLLKRMILSGGIIWVMFLNRLGSVLSGVRGFESIIIKEVNSLKAQGVDLLSHWGAESHQLSLLTNLLDTVILSIMEDRWFFDLNGDGRFCVKDVRCLLDDVFPPKAEVPTRNVTVASLLCPLCDSGMEDAAHLFFRCDMAKDVIFLVLSLKVFLKESFISLGGAFGIS
nr:RNA-directed DNA polymerase, eukaryota [Tanacetum cinerariifolium]